MTHWRPDFNPDNLYFVTTNAVQHRHLFRSDVIKRLAVDSLDCMRLRKRLKLYVFVIMPNHIHGIIVLTDHGRGTLQRARTDRPRAYPGNVGARSNVPLPLI